MAEPATRELQRLLPGTPLADVLGWPPALRWQALPVRWQLLISISAISICAVMLSIVLAIADARERVEIEVEASMKNAYRLVTEAVHRAAAEAPRAALIDLIPNQLRTTRHVRLFVTDREGDLVPFTQSRRNLPHEHEQAPRWFAELVGPAVNARQVRVMLGASRVGGVVIAGEPRDELGEVWEEISRRAVIWLAITGLMLALLYVVLGRLLNPLVELVSGMHELEDGRYGARVAAPSVRELATIAGRFNRLAETLGEARAETTRLHRDLITAQENERRQIANELHDEAGPCLFGITANAASIGRIAEEAGDAQRAPIGARVSEIQNIAERLKMINRDLLRNLRPVELGTIPLNELIGSLIAGFQRRFPQCGFTASFGRLGRSYGDDVELGIFRCVQQVLSSAGWKTAATEVRIDIREHGISGTEGGRALGVEMYSDAVPDETSGSDIRATALRERVRSIGGSCRVELSRAGTLVSIDIPLGACGERQAARGDAAMAPLMPSRRQSP